MLVEDPDPRSDPPTGSYGPARNRRRSAREHSAGTGGPPVLLGASPDRDHRPAAASDRDEHDADEPDPGAPEAGAPATGARDTTARAAEAAEDAPLRVQVARSFGWALVGQIAQRGLVWLTTIALVRILDSEDYGTYSIAVTVTMFLLALNDLAVGYAITRYQGDDVEELAGTAATVALGLSLCLYATIFVAAPGIVALFNPPAGSPAVGVVRLAALAIVIDGCIAAPTGLITRALQEKIRVTCELTGFGFSTALVFGLAFAGAGAWSLAAGQVVGAAITAVLLFARSPIRVRFRWDPARVPGLVRFGAPLMLAGALNQLILNTDYVVVNRYLSLGVAGAYFLAFNVANWPVTLISFAMRRTAMAGFSRLQDDARAMQHAFERTVELLVTATLPMALLISLQAREIILFLFGPKWLAGATALRFLAGISVIRLVFVLCLDVLAAKGRSMVILWVQALWFAALVGGMVWGATRHGLVGVGVAQLAAALLVALPLVAGCMSREGIHLARVLPRLVRPLLGGAAMVGACLAARAPFDEVLVRLVIGSLAGIAVYGLVALPGTPTGRMLRDAVDRRRGRPAERTGVAGRA